LDNYIGFKMIKAEPMTKNEFNKFHGEKYNHPYAIDTEDVQGYKVVYADGYESWSPKEVFEAAYMQVSEKNTITADNVESFIACYEDFKIGEKTTVVKATLVNGFIIVESSSCVDPANFNQDMGIDICLERIKNKVWELLGFMLQTAQNGIK